MHWCVFGAKGASIREIIDPLSVSCYLYKVPQEHAYPCVLTAGEYREIPGPASLAGLVPEAASSKVWPQSPNRSRLAKGRDTSLTRVKERRGSDISHRSSRVSPPRRAMRAGTGETELAFPA